jgi:hypothetical protein
MGFKPFFWQIKKIKKPTGIIFIICLLAMVYGDVGGGGGEKKRRKNTVRRG